MEDLMAGYQSKFQKWMMASVECVHPEAGLDDDVAEEEEEEQLGVSGAVFKGRDVVTEPRVRWADWPPPDQDWSESKSVLDRDAAETLSQLSLEPSLLDGRTMELYEDPAGAVGSSTLSDDISESDVSSLTKKHRGVVAWPGFETARRVKNLGVRSKGLERVLADRLFTFAPLERATRRSEPKPPAYVSHVASSRGVTTVGVEKSSGAVFMVHCTARGRTRCRVANSVADKFASRAVLVENGWLESLCPNRDLTDIPLAVVLKHFREQFGDRGGPPPIKLDPLVADARIIDAVIHGGPAAAYERLVLFNNLHVHSVTVTVLPNGDLECTIDRSGPIRDNNAAAVLRELRLAFLDNAHASDDFHGARCLLRDARLKRLVLAYLPTPTAPNVPHALPDLAARFLLVVAAAATTSSSSSSSSSKATKSNTNKTSSFLTVVPPPSPIASDKAKKTLGIFHTTHSSSSSSSSSRAPNSLSCHHGAVQALLDMMALDTLPQLFPTKQQQLGGGGEEDQGLFVRHLSNSDPVLFTTGHDTLNEIRKVPGCASESAVRLLVAGGSNSKAPTSSTGSSTFGVIRPCSVAGVPFSLGALPGVVGW